MKTETKAKASTKKAKKVDTAPPQDDGLNLPASLRVENRKPLTPEQKAKVAATEQKQKPPKAEPVKVAKAAKGPSLSHALKALVAKTPKMPLDEVIAQLEAAGFKGRSKVTIATLRSDALTTLQAAKACGLYSGDL